MNRTEYRTLCQTRLHAALTERAPNDHVPLKDWAEANGVSYDKAATWARLGLLKTVKKGPYYFVLRTLEPRIGETDGRKAVLPPGNTAERTGVTGANRQLVVSAGKTSGTACSKRAGKTRRKAAA